MARADRAVAGTAALGMALLGFLPIANWISGGHGAPWYGATAAAVALGTAVMVGLAVAAAMLTRNLPQREGLQGSPPARIAGAAAAWAVAVAVLALVLYAAVSRSVFSARPLLIDEIVQTWQARVYGSGHLTTPAPDHPEFFRTNLMLYLNGRVSSQFPPGGPAMVAPASLLGIEWLTGPLFGAASVLGMAALAGRIEPRPAVRIGAVLLFAMAPFAVFMSGSLMNHVPALTWLFLGLVGLARATGANSLRARDAALAGFGFGMAATIRPTDAIAFAIPAGLWLLVRATRSRQWLPLAASAVALAAPIGAILWVNAEVTGSPLRFAYQALWGETQSLGFQVSPYGDLHTPARGLELVNLYFLSLQTYLFELPLPGLLPAMVALALVRVLSPFDRYLLASALLLVLGYFAYWHDGFYLGPRFMYPLLPLLAVWTSRCPALILERWPQLVVRRGLAAAAILAVGFAAFRAGPARARQYRSAMIPMRWDADSAAAQAGVRNALVLVRESWGAQLMARLWAAGISFNKAERHYRRTDACSLERGLDTIEVRGLRGAAALAVLEPLLADSARLIRSPLTPDYTLRLLPGARYSAECLLRLRQDQSGYTSMVPLLLAGAAEVIYARDLHARNSLLARAYPDRALYLLKPPDSRYGTPPGFFPLDRDSALDAWRTSR